MTKKETEISDLPFVDADTSLARITVTLFCIKTKKMCCVHLARIPRLGELLQLNLKLFQVDEIVHGYSYHESRADPSAWPVSIFVTEVTQESQELLFISKDDWDRQDDLGYFCQD